MKKTALLMAAILVFACTACGQPVSTGVPSSASDSAALSSGAEPSVDPPQQKTSGGELEDLPPMETDALKEGPVPAQVPRTVGDLSAMYMNDIGTAQVAVYVDDGSAPRRKSFPSAGAGRAPANTGYPEDKDAPVTLDRFPEKTEGKLIPAQPEGREDRAKAPAPEPEAPREQWASPADATPPEEAGSGEEYTQIQESGFLSAAASPLSTFAVEADTAAYSNVRRLIVQGWPIEPEAVRIEEMINYFHYDYPAPENGEPFSVKTEMAPCPWNSDTNLLLVGLQARELDMAQRKPSNLVYLLDVSGSMSDGNKLPLVKRAFRLLTENLGENDRISIVTYASTDAVILEGAKGSDQYAIMSAIEALDAGGSTHGSRGIQTAYRIARENFIEGGINRVILATDGDLNVGLTSEEELTKLIEEKRDSGVFLSVLGFGYGNLKDDRLEALAKNGNGNYYYIDSLLEAKKVLVEQLGGTLSTVAKDVKIQVEFNLEQVKGYRLIGYENRMLAAEDFLDDTKDAGEIGAGHRVTALYEIAGPESAQTVEAGTSKEQPKPYSGGDSLMTVKIRYKQPDGSVSQELDFPVETDAYRETMSPDMNFASAVAQTGLILRQSDYAGSASYEGVLEQLGDLRAFEDDAYKQEFCLLVQLLAQGKQ